MILFCTFYNINVKGAGYGYIYVVDGMRVTLQIQNVLMRFYEPNPTYAEIVFFFRLDAVPLDIKFFTEFRLRLKSGFKKSFTEVKKMCEKKTGKSYLSSW